MGLRHPLQIPPALLQLLSLLQPPLWNQQLKLRLLSQQLKPHLQNRKQLLQMSLLATVTQLTLIVVFHPLLLISTVEILVNETLLF